MYKFVRFDSFKMNAMCTFDVNKKYAASTQTRRVGDFVCNLLFTNT